MHNILLYIVHHVQVLQITESSTLVLTTHVLLDKTAAVLTALGRIPHSQRIQGLLTPQTAGQPLTTCQCLWKPALKGDFGLAVSRLWCCRTRNVLDTKCQPLPCPTPACPHPWEVLSSDALQRILFYLIIISLKFYAYAMAAWFKTLVYWLPTVTHWRRWILFPLISVSILKAYYKRFLTLFLHFDFCSTNYKNVLKFNSFSLLKKKSPRKTGAVCN